MKFSVVISTYQRDDKRSPELLKRALDSVFNQTYKNFKVFLIGDKYEDKNEILKIVSNYDTDKLFFENLSYAKERDKYVSNKSALWSYGGVNAMNYGVSKSLNDGYEYICHLDHDDWWLPNHLEEIKNCIVETGASWVCTKSTYRSENVFLPKLITNENYINFLPKSSTLIHSSVCMNFKHISLFYRDIYEITNKVGLPADADLWERTRDYIQNNNLKSYYINKLTCRHDEEGYSRK
jgi:glycosyltransferase involved in cell wall biosynthesis